MTQEQCNVTSHEQEAKLHLDSSSEEQCQRSQLTENVYIGVELHVDRRDKGESVIYSTYLLPRGETRDTGILTARHRCDIQFKLKLRIQKKILRKKIVVGAVSTILAGLETIPN